MGVLDAIILRSLQGSATPEEVAELEAWRRESPAHEASYRQAAQIWHIVGAHDDGVVSTPPSAETLIRLPIRSERVAESAPGRRPRSRSHGGWIAAAVVALLLLAGWLLLPDGSSPVAFGIEEFRTGSTETVTVRLVDGTIVRLAPDSRLRLSEGGRDVWLDGQAFFAVARHPGMPFVVHTGTGAVQVLGTRFDVRARGEEFRTVVVDGHVSVAANGARVLVDAGQISELAPGGRPSVSDVEDVYSLLDWLGQSMVFQDTLLGRVVEELHRKYDVRIEVVGDALPGRTVTAWFTDESFGEAFEVICDVVGAACAIDNGTAIMKPRM